MESDGERERIRGKQEDGRMREGMVGDLPGEPERLTGCLFMELLGVWKMW